MSNYIPKKIDHNAWISITAAIRGYPQMAIELAEEEESIINGTPEKQACVKSGGPGNPTEAKAARLSSARLETIRRKCNAVRKCFDLLPNSDKPYICYRFWGVQSLEKAMQSRGKPRRMQGMKIESSFDITVCDKVNRGKTRVKDVIRAFIEAVGAELGEI